MTRLLSAQKAPPTLETAAIAARKIAARRIASFCAAAVLLAGGLAAAQVITIDSHGGQKGAPVDRRYQQITPTHVTLTKSELDPKTRQELIRLMQAEQGFAMRPFPRGHKGLTLVANGKLDPAGEHYLEMVVKEGLSAKPGDRVVVTSIKFERSKMIFDLNGGPDPKHRFMRHIQVGGMGGMNPVVQDDGQETVGARLTLNFEDHVPELTGAEVKALLAPMISFDVKTPIQAFTDTLPPGLKDAILNHHVLVGMSTEMVLFAKGQPEAKSREMEGQMPFEEWIYGQAPKEVDFVRINGNRVIRVEVAKMGEKPVVFTRDEVEGLMRTDGTPLNPGGDPGIRTVKVGDVQRDPDTQAPLAPPSLKNPGETIPVDSRNTGVMKPVQFPKPKPADPQPSAQPGTQSGSQSGTQPNTQPGSNPDGEPEAQPPATQTPSDSSAPAPAKPQTAGGSSQPD
jgi:hypothetical protein